MELLQVSQNTQHFHIYDMVTNVFTTQYDFCKTKNRAWLENAI